MSFWQAVLYFFREAVVSVLRSWKISSIAILTIALSLFLSGAFYLATQNLARAAVRLGNDVKVVAYLEPEAASEALTEFETLLASPEWVASVTPVSSEDAMGRFQKNFPSLADLATNWEGEGLPSSLEARLETSAIRDEPFDAWLTSLREHSVTSLVDDDRDWLGQLSALLAVARAVGITLGATLLTAAVFTIASVVRLTAYLYLDEISVMRMVGATEFYIRGPFYAEGFLQGLLGGAVAAVGLRVGWELLRLKSTGAYWSSALTNGYLTPREQAVFVGLGALGGLFGAVVSLRRERLSVDE